jgi:hypothetical protein
VKSANAIMSQVQYVIGIEINAKFVGALFTERIDQTLRIFCLYTNGDTSQFDVPAEENLDSLHHFFSKLNTEVTCTSVIVDEVVQGRVFVRSGEHHWLYTLLSTPGNVLPPFNADICSLPWQPCWLSSEADILEYGKPGDSVHCFAVRTQVSENDALRMVKDAKVFTNPKSLSKKSRHRWLYLNLAVVLVILAILIAATIRYTFKGNAGKTIEPDRVTHVTSVNLVTNYYLLQNRQISGPYAEKTIADMSAGGLLNASTMCRAENSTEWISLARVIPPKPAQ